MHSWLRLLALAGLSLVLAGSSCNDDEAVTLEQLRQDVAPPFDYSLYCDEQGRLRGKGSDVLLVHRSAHVEQVYADAQRGDARARTLFAQLETQASAAGGLLADQALGLVCTSLPSCTVRWSFLDKLIPSRDAGGMRLRHVLAQSFERAARLKGVQNAVLTSALSVLMVGSALQKAEASAAGAEMRAGVAEGAALQPYGGPGGGHHVPAKSAFTGAAGYDANAALAIPNAELARLGINHPLVTTSQMRGYRALAQSGESLTWEAVTRIEADALVAGGMTRDMASATVNQAIEALKQAGVAGPTRIPWGGR